LEALGALKCFQLCHGRVNAFDVQIHRFFAKRCLPCTGRGRHQVYVRVGRHVNDHSVYVCTRKRI
jgi:hypothetical protein